MLEMKSGKCHMAKGVEQLNQEVIETETYKYLAMLKADTIKQVEMKE